MEQSNYCISVVIPAYNSEETISQCLQSLHQQTVLPLEIIVVDDGSRDCTVEIALQWAKVIYNTRKKGPGGARNTGVRVVAGDIVAFIDSDCVAPNDWVANIYNAFCDDAVVAVGGGYCSGMDDSFWQQFSYEELAFRRRNRTERVATLVSNNFACRKSIFWEIGGFPEEYLVCEDMFFSYRISRKGKIIWLPNNGVQHHFKTSLKAYIKHQYIFGTESTRFLLQHPKILAIDHHQGKTLYVAIIIASLFLLSAVMASIYLLVGNSVLSGVSFQLLILLLLGHLLVYAPFIRYLAHIKFPHIAKAYTVSLLRDLVCALSFVDGLMRALRDQVSIRNSCPKEK